MAIELSTEQLERQIAAFERRMHEAGEDEDYDEAARLKHRIEPLKVELGQRKVAEQQAAEKNIERAVMKAEARKADVEADMIVAHFEKPSTHDKQMLSSVGKDSGTVVDGDGKTVGKIEMNNAIAAMARPERDKGTPRYK